ncbi:MAG: hypothetical protein H0V89_03425, partial [Deltaproteobacteria bacterium]|nr:hypothetical protein [Deltaproteobacteria bacterium]
MPTLRTRIFSATGFLIGLQVLGTGLGLASWVQVQAACQRQLAIGDDRAALLQ